MKFRYLIQFTSNNLCVLTFKISSCRWSKVQKILIPSRVKYSIKFNNYSTIFNDCRSIRRYKYELHRVSAFVYSSVSFNTILLKFHHDIINSVFPVNFLCTFVENYGQLTVQ